MSLFVVNLCVSQQTKSAFHGNQPTWFSVICLFLIAVFSGCDRSSSNAPANENSTIAFKKLPSADLMPMDEANLTLDCWYKVKMFGNHVGWSRITRQKINDNGQSLWKTTTESKFKVKRQGHSTELGATISVIEDTQGKLIRVTKQINMSNVTTITMATVVGANLEIYNMRTQKLIKRITWNDEVVVQGGIGFEMKLKQQKLSPGQKWDWQVLQTDADSDVILAEHWQVEKYENANSIGKKVSENKIKLSLVKSIATFPGGRKATKSYWFDGNQQLVKITAVGVELNLATRQQATSSTNQQFDALVDMLVPVDKPLKNPAGSKLAVYRVKSTLGKSLQDLIPTGFTQEVKQITPSTLEISVRATTPYTKKNERFVDTSKPTDDDRNPNQLIQSDDPRIIKLANSIAIRETSRWKIAQAVVQFVGNYIQESNYSTGFASAAEVLKSKSGDCTEHSVLLIALLRAKKIPARAVTGLVYIPDRQVMGFHMWAEAWINERWVPLDAVFGHCGIGHLKISHSSLASGLSDPAISLATIQVIQTKLTIQLLEEK